MMFERIITLWDGIAADQLGISWWVCKCKPFVYEDLVGFIVRVTHFGSSCFSAINVSCMEIWRLVHIKELKLMCLKNSWLGAPGLLNADHVHPKLFCHSEMENVSGDRWHLICNYELWPLLMWAKKSGRLPCTEVISVHSCAGYRMKQVIVSCNLIRMATIQPLFFMGMIFWISL